MTMKKQKRKKSSRVKRKSAKALLRRNVSKFCSCVGSSVQTSSSSDSEEDEITNTSQYHRYVPPYMHQWMPDDSPEAAELAWDTLPKDLWRQEQSSQTSDISGDDAALVGSTNTTKLTVHDQCAESQQSPIEEDMQPPTRAEADDSDDCPVVPTSPPINTAIVTLCIQGQVCLVCSGQTECDGNQEIDMHGEQDNNLHYSDDLLVCHQEPVFFEEEDVDMVEEENSFVNVECSDVVHTYYHIAKDSPKIQENKEELDSEERASSPNTSSVNVEFDHTEDEEHAEGSKEANDESPSEAESFGEKDNQPAENSRPDVGESVTLFEVEQADEAEEASEIALIQEKAVSDIITTGKRMVDEVKALISELLDICTHTRGRVVIPVAAHGDFDEAPSTSSASTQTGDDSIPNNEGQGEHIHREVFVQQQVPIREYDLDEQPSDVYSSELSGQFDQTEEDALPRIDDLGAERREESEDVTHCNPFICQQDTSYEDISSDEGSEQHTDDLDPTADMDVHDDIITTDLTSVDAVNGGKVCTPADNHLRKSPLLATNEVGTETQLVTLSPDHQQMVSDMENTANDSDGGETNESEGPQPPTNNETEVPILKLVGFDVRQLSQEDSGKEHADSTISKIVGIDAAGQDTMTVPLTGCLNGEGDSLNVPATPEIVLAEEQEDTGEDGVSERDNSCFDASSVEGDTTVNSSDHKQDHTKSGTAARHCDSDDIASMVNNTPMNYDPSEKFDEIPHDYSLSPEVDICDCLRDEQGVLHLEADTWGMEQSESYVLPDDNVLTGTSEAAITLEAYNHGSGELEETQDGFIIAPYSWTDNTPLPQEEFPEEDLSPDFEADDIIVNMLATVSAMGDVPLGKRRTEDKSPVLQVRCPMKYDETPLMGTFIEKRKDILEELFDICEERLEKIIPYETDSDDEEKTVYQQDLNDDVGKHTSEYFIPNSETESSFYCEVTGEGSFDATDELTDNSDEDDGFFSFDVGNTGDNTAQKDDPTRDATAETNPITGPQPTEDLGKEGRRSIPARPITDDHYDSDVTDEAMFSSTEEITTPTDEAIIQNINVGYHSSSDGTIKSDDRFSADDVMCLLSLSIVLVFLYFNHSSTFYEMIGRWVWICRMIIELILTS